MVIELHRANNKTIELAGGGTLTLECSNLFAMHIADRAFVLSILAQIEEYETTRKAQIIAAYELEEAEDGSPE